MSSTKSRIPLGRAERLAEQIVDLLAASCERIEVAGSIRRRKEQVGDIEIICVPKLVPGLDQVDLFGAPVRAAQATNLLDGQIAGYLGGAPFGPFQHRLDVNGRKSCGERYKRLTYLDVPLDLFSVLPPAQWGVLYTIRTGPAEFSHRLVTPRLQGGWMPSGMRVQDGALWDRGAIVQTPEEADFFAALGLEVVPPEQRVGNVAPPRIKVPA
jgi:DNA polymerase/3'-5' exonuclease PolX